MGQWVVLGRFSRLVRAVGRTLSSLCLRCPLWQEVLMENCCTTAWASRGLPNLVNCMGDYERVLGCCMEEVRRGSDSKRSTIILRITDQLQGSKFKTFTDEVLQRVAIGNPTTSSHTRESVQPFSSSRCGLTGSLDYRFHSFAQRKKVSETSNSLAISRIALLSIYIKCSLCDP